MSFTLPQLFRGWRAALLIAAAALCSPEKASAGCGDYITYGKSGSPGHGHQSMANDPATPTTPAKTPCQGPNCSGGPVREFPPIPPAPVSTPTKESARPFPTVADADAHDAALQYDRDSPFPRPIDRSDSIFHPPRVG